MMSSRYTLSHVASRGNQLGGTLRNCKYFGSSTPSGWTCPPGYVASGARIDAPDENGVICNGGIANGATCDTSGGHGADGTLTIRGGKITAVTVTNGGTGYHIAPLIEVIGNGKNAQIVANVKAGSISSFTIKNNGYGYDRNTHLSIVSRGVGDGALIDPVMKNGRLVGLTIVNSGSGYIVEPDISIEPNLSGNKPRASSTISNGRVTNVTLLDKNVPYGNRIEPQVTVIARSIRCKYCHLCCKDDGVKKILTGLEAKVASIDKLMHKLSKQSNGNGIAIQQNTADSHVSNSSNRGASSSPSSIPVPVPKIEAQSTLTNISKTYDKIDVKQLKQTVSNADNENEDEDEDATAQAYDKVAGAQVAAINAKYEQAKKLWVVIQAAIKEDAEMAKEAREYNMDPPPPRYTKDQIDKVKTIIARGPAKELSVKQKAKCMRLLQQSMQAQTALTQATALGNVQTEEQVTLAKQTHDLYTSQCSLEKQ